MFCDTYVICASLDRAKEKRIVASSYKVVSDHSSTCFIVKDIWIQKLTKSVYYDEYNDLDEYIENAFQPNLHSTNSILLAND